MRASFDISGKGWGVFHRSSFCESGNCVEVAFLEKGSVLVRNSRCREAGMLEFTADEWSAFVRGVVGGEFEDPTRPTSHT